MLVITGQLSLKVKIRTEKIDPQLRESVTVIDEMILNTRIHMTKKRYGGLNETHS